MFQNLRSGPQPTLTSWVWAHVWVVVADRVHSFILDSEPRQMKSSRKMSPEPGPYRLSRVTNSDLKIVGWNFMKCWYLIAHIFT